MGFKTTQSSSQLATLTAIQDAIEKLEEEKKYQNNFRKTTGNTTVTEDDYVVVNIDATDVSFTLPNPSSLLNADGTSKKQKIINLGGGNITFDKQIRINSDASSVTHLTVLGRYATEMSLDSIGSRIEYISDGTELIAIGW